LTAGIQAAIGIWGEIVSNAPKTDKTSRLKMKSFSTMRDTKRGSQSYMEKRRGRRELHPNEMRWNQ